MCHMGLGNSHQTAFGYFLLCLSQVELELESVKKQQASAADSSTLVTREEVNILR